MGSINSRGGRLQLDFRYQGIRCREQTRIADTPANRKKLQTTLNRIEAEITLGRFDYAVYFPKSPKVTQFETIDKRKVQARTGHPTFEVFTETWFNELEMTWRDSYRTTVRSTLDSHLVPEFGISVISGLDRASMLSYRARLTKKRGRTGTTLSAERVNHIMSILRRVFEEASLRYNFPSPMEGIKSLPVPRTHVEPFDLDEVQTILDNVRPDFRNYYTVRFFTGLRTGEIDGLTWQNVDLNRKQLLIRQSLVNGKLGPTKTDGSTREVQLSGPVINALKDQRCVNCKHDLVFCNSVGEALSHNNVTKRVWYPLLKHLELKKRRPYQTRHTAASLWLASGEQPEFVARQLGHTTTEMLFRRYSRYIPNITRKDGSAFELLLKSQLQTTEKADQ